MSGWVQSMSKLVASNCWQLAMRTAVTGLTLSLLSGCSSDVSRFSNPFSNPFASSAYAADNTPTGDIPAIKRKLPKTVVSRALPAPTKAATLAKLAAPVDATPTGSVVKHVAAASAGGWSLAGGTPIVAANGETAAMLSRRYGVPEAALLSANGFNTAAQIQPGTRLVVPVYNAGTSAASTSAVVKSVPKIVPVAAAKVAPKLVAHAPAKTKLQFVKGAQPAHTLAVAKTVAAKPVTVASAQKVHVIKAIANTPQLAAKAAPTVVAAAKPTLKPAAVKPVLVAAAVVPKTSVKQVVAPAIVDTTPTASLAPNNAKPEIAAAAPAVAEANPEFRWPARGRIIQSFKSGGNDGINIAVPEGTSVKAAEGGVVAYSGSELKGYGNLVLIRHPNGFVSAYANNGELLVKRGDQVKRGQIVAKSGQTGNVASPQLHFELRKGSTPVDPTNYLAGL